jgi:hypothetical protein
MRITQQRGIEAYLVGLASFYARLGADRRARRLPTLRPGICPEQSPARRVLIREVLESTMDVLYSMLNRVLQREVP